jgi:hypothetical protein
MEADQHGRRSGDLRFVHEISPVRLHGNRVRAHHEVHEAHEVHEGVFSLAVLRMKAIVIFVIFVIFVVFVITAGRRTGG